MVYNTQAIIKLFMTMVRDGYNVERKENSVIVTPKDRNGYGVHFDLHNWFLNQLWVKGVEWEGGCVCSAFYTNQKSNFIERVEFSFNDENTGFKFGGAKTLRGARMPWCK